ncbi:hypothetical protein KW807_01080 [Candidatus Parcubacteria bacterium]|nr:hypothetical protein [Candidatus Parcubacteria bacterium]
MFWEYVRLYVYVSLAIGLITVFVALWNKRHKILYDDDHDREVAEETMRHAVKVGEVQREEYGERVVYYGLDPRGKAAVSALELSRNLKKNHKVAYLTLFYLLGVIDTTITWPVSVIGWLRKIIYKPE